MKLKDIVTLQAGLYAQSTPKDNAVYVQVRDFSPERRLSKGIKPSVEIEGRTQNLFLSSGDLLFAAKGNNNFCAVFQGLDYPAVASSSFLTLRIKRSDEVLPEYICWYINLDSTLKYLRSKAEGTGIPSISKATLAELDIPFPSIETQKKIVAIARLQADIQSLQKRIMEMRQQIIEYRLKKMIENE